MTTNPDRCPKCAYPTVIEDRAALVDHSQHGHCPRCGAQLTRALGTLFWRLPSRRRHRAAAV